MLRSACPTTGKTPALEGRAGRCSQQLRCLGSRTLHHLPAHTLCRHRIGTAVYATLSRRKYQWSVARPAIPLEQYNRPCRELFPGSAPLPPAEHSQAVDGTRQGLCPLPLPLARPHPAPASQQRIQHRLLSQPDRRVDGHPPRTRQEPRRTHRLLPPAHGPLVRSGQRPHPLGRIYLFRLRPLRRKPEHRHRRKKNEFTQAPADALRFGKYRIPLPLCQKR